MSPSQELGNPITSNRQDQNEFPGNDLLSGEQDLIQEEPVRERAQFRPDPPGKEQPQRLQPERQLTDLMYSEIKPSSGRQRGNFQTPLNKGKENARGLTISSPFQLREMDEYL